MDSRMESSRIELRLFMHPSSGPYKFVRRGLFGRDRWRIVRPTCVCVCTCTPIPKQPVILLLVLSATANEWNNWSSSLRYRFATPSARRSASAKTESGAVVPNQTESGRPTTITMFPLADKFSVNASTMAPSFDR